MMVDLCGMCAYFHQFHTVPEPFFVTYVYRKHKIERTLMISGNLHPADSRQEGQLVRNFSVTEKADFFPQFFQRDFHRGGSAERISVRINMAADGNGFSFPEHSGDFFRIPAHRFHWMCPPFRPYPPGSSRYARRIQCFCH